MATLADTAHGLSRQHLDAHRRAFETACTDPVATRERLLQSLVAPNSRTEFGRAHGFERIRCCDDWQTRIPMGDYASHAPWIARIMAGSECVLTSSPVQSLSPTSGSSGGQKLIPFTAPFAAAIERSIATWLGDLTVGHPTATAGAAYWSISPPAMPASHLASAIPIRLPADTDYVSPALAAELANWLIVPTLASDTQQLLENTVSSLWGHPDLGMISVWSPSFFLLLDDVLRREFPVGDATWGELWPRLRLLSCWTHGEAARWLPAVRRRLGDVPIQGKGLLSTEGVTSIPIGAGDPVLALTGQLIEFRDGDRTIWPDQAATGHDYEVVLSTQAGLYRYATADRVQVTGWYAPGVPRLRFMGRGESWSDRVGEKLSSGFVAQVLAACDGPAWCVLVAGDRGYTLVVGGDLEPARTLGSVDRGLRANPYYAQACATGQLVDLAIMAVPSERLETLISCLARRQDCRFGDVKLPALITDPTILECLT